MPSKVFLDANILVYAVDPSHSTKQRRSIDLLGSVSDVGRGLLSTQVVGEFFHAVTRRIRHPMSVEDAARRVRELLEAWPVALVTEMVLVEAVRGVKDYRFSYWDAQIWATALLNQAPLVLSEDFQDGLDAEGVRFLNPFSEKFAIESILGTP